MQRTIHDIRQRRVLVAHEAVKRAAAETKQPEAADAGAMPRRHAPAAARSAPWPVPVPTVRRPAPPSPAYGISSADTWMPSTCGYVARNFVARKWQKPSRSELGKFIVSRWMKFFIESVAIEPGVVAGRVGGPEGVAVEQHQHAGAEHRALTSGRPTVAVEAIDDHVAFAVVAALPAAGELFHGISSQAACTTSCSETTRSDTPAAALRELVIGRGRQAWRRGPPGRRAWYGP